MTLYAISGPSGSGKTSSIRQVLTNEVVSFTTRSPRVGEVDGVDYHFQSLAYIDELDKEGTLIERVQYGEHHYGITEEELTSKLAKGDAFVIVDYHGYVQLQKICPDVVGIFIKITAEEAKERMAARGDTAENIEKRLRTYEEELDNARHYDYVLTNVAGKQTKTVALLKKIIVG